MRDLGWKDYVKITIALLGILLLILAGCANMSPAEQAIVLEAEKDLIGAGEQLAEKAVEQELGK